MILEMKLNFAEEIAWKVAAGSVLRWCQPRGLAELSAVRPVHLAAYIEELGRRFSRPTVKQHLSCIRILFDWLIVGQVVPSNPAHAVRSPKRTGPEKRLFPNGDGYRLKQQPG